MKRNKVVTAEEAISAIKDGDVVCVTGFLGAGTADNLLLALGKRYLESAAPKDMTLLYSSGPGDAKDRGLNRVGIEGMWKRVIAGHYGLVPKISQLVQANAVEGYNLPQGILTNFYRAVGGRRPGVLTKVGLGTFVDPRIEGGKTNERAKEDLVDVVTLGGEEWIFMKSFPLNVALIRGTTADAAGNISFEREILTIDGLAMATAVHNSGGVVIVQVERVAAKGTLKPKDVKIPGILVDYVVVSEPQYHMQTFGTQFSPVFAGEIKVDMQAKKRMALDERKIIARRAAMELAPFDTINLGIGVPEGVSGVANEEKILSYLTMTVEPGIIGGMPMGGLDFGASVNSEALVDMPDMFNFYDSGGLDLTCLGMAQCDATGNVNSSKFGKRLAGCGGFIDISQNAKKVIFVGTMTADGLEISVKDGKLNIDQEGKAKKFVQQVQQITFAGKIAAQGPQEIFYVTERAVFKLVNGQVELIEVAPGIDIEKDVLAQMDFRPVMSNVKQMDARIFREEPMGIHKAFLMRALERRIQYDAASNTLHLNFSGLEVTDVEDCELIRDVATARCVAAGKKVNAIVNYDAFSISEDLIDKYLDITGPVIRNYYANTTRFTSSDEMRSKLVERFQQHKLVPAFFANEKEASRVLTQGAH